MSRRVVIVGSGKMARDIGAYLVGRGMAVTWVARSAESLDEIRRHARQTLRQLSRSGQVLSDSDTPTFHLSGDPGLPKAAVVLECIAESLDAKREALAGVAEALTPTTLLLSNTSSIVPRHIDPRCLGMHFFYPVLMRPLVEVVAADDCQVDIREAAVAFARGLGLTVIVESDKSAFAANRLLLPLQAECFRALEAGVPPAAVDRSSTLGLMPHGQCALLDAIGLDVVAPAVVNYVSRMAADLSSDFTGFTAALGRLIGMGKRGEKCADGLLCGAPLPWRERSLSESEERDLQSVLRATFVNTCARFVAEHELTGAEVDLIMRDIFGCRSTLTELAAEGEVDRARAILQPMYERTGMSYFRSAA